MARSFRLADHQCPQLIELLQRNEVSYVWSVCDCSSLERSYEILVDGEWSPMRYCIYCGAPMVLSALSILRQGTAQSSEVTPLSKDFDFYSDKVTPMPFYGDRPHLVPCDKCGKSFQTIKHISHGICPECSKA